MLFSGENPKPKFYRKQKSTHLSYRVLWSEVASLVAIGSSSSRKEAFETSLLFIRGNPCPDMLKFSRSSPYEPQDYAIDLLVLKIA